MSRPSRGFSVPHAPLAPPPVCPTTGTASITQSNPSFWTVDFDWSPSVLVNTPLIRYRINDGDWQDYVTNPPANGSTEVQLDPHDLADSEDTLWFYCQCTDVAGCPDFDTDNASRIVDPI